MRLRAIACLLALCLAGPALGQTVKLPDKLTTPPGRLAALKIEYDGDDIRWDVPPELDVFREYDPDPKVIRLRLIGYAKADGKAYTVRLLAVTTKDKKLSPFAACAITVGGGKPDPDPDPDPKPIAGLKVLILEETADRPKLPSAQQSLLTGKKFRDFLDGKCADDPDTNTKKAWRIADKDQDLRQVAKYYQDAQAKAKGQPMPRIVVGSDQGVIYEGPLPASLSEAQALINKFTPAKGHLKKAG